MGGLRTSILTQPVPPREIIRTKADDTAPVGITTGEPDPTYVSVTFTDYGDNEIPTQSFNSNPL